MEKKDLFAVQNPLKDYFRITYEYGKKYKWGIHIGLDLGTIEKGTYDNGIGRPVYPCANGVFKKVGFDPKGGNYVVIDHLNGFVSKYFHLSEVYFKDGWTTVTMDKKIGLSGNSGTQTTAAHLHWELWYKGDHVNPLDYLYRSKKITEILYHSDMLNKKLNDYFGEKKV